MYGKVDETTKDTRNERNVKVENYHQVNEAVLTNISTLAVEVLALWRVKFQYSKGVSAETQKHLMKGL